MKTSDLLILAGAGVVALLILRPTRAAAPRSSAPAAPFVGASSADVWYPTAGGWHFAPDSPF